jgi:uncharacterized membrane protein
MFYDESARSEPSNRQRPLKLFRFTMTGVIIALLAPFVMLAFAPVILMLLPLALVAMAIMVPALVGGGHPNQLQSGRVQVWQFAPALHA